MHSQAFFRAGAAGRLRRPSINCGVGTRIESPRCTKYQVRICTNKVCKKQGSQQVLKFAQDLGLEELEVQQCGCLGNCGNGPNIALLPQELMLRHVSTPSDLADLLNWQCGLNISPDLLKATELRLAGNALASSGDLPGALAKWEEALEMNPERGKHMLYSNMAVTHLQLGHKEASLDMARKAVAAAPQGFHVAYVRLVDALYALGKYDDAAEVVQDALGAHPGFAHIPEYKIIQKALAKHIRAKVRA